MLEKLAVSPYLLAPPRSLRQACIDIAGCGGSRELCATCSLLQLCMPDERETARLPAVAEHQLQHLGIRVIARPQRRAPATVTLRSA
ncbi:MAG TPA: hypothetical protein VMC10_22000 [Stellaceae bacterium]|nr:hypothetical protein [Stellaceae bacterium]